MYQGQENDSKKYLNTVKPERSGFRDLGFSEHHRTWGYDVPAVDIDFLLCEYDQKIPKALIEYKSVIAVKQNSGMANYCALKRLASDANIPFFAVRYSQDFTQYKVTGLNELGKKLLERSDNDMSELDYLGFLFFVRGFSFLESRARAYEILHKRENNNRG